jgi:hypothetical protein
MSARTNACSELTRFWLEARHGCLALHPLGNTISLPNGQSVGPRLIVETKDEHDWEPSGREFGALLRADVEKMGSLPYVPRGAKGVKFSMLREEHYEQATALFGTDDFDRLFVVHAVAPEVLADLAPELARCRIHWLTIPDLVRDLVMWYRDHKRPAALRTTLVGDLFHLLFGFCRVDIPSTLRRI